jgi:biotin synthase-related radical SAM superfamily protein
MVYVGRMQLAKKSIEKNEISVCDILKDNTTKVIRKIESQIPTNIQAYSDLYTDYLHMLDDYFGTCYLWQKQYFDMFGLDSQTLNAINDYWSTVTDLYCTQIEMITSAQKSNIDMREKMIKLGDQYIHQALDYYGKVFSQTLSKINEKN